MKEAKPGCVSDFYEVHICLLGCKVLVNQKVDCYCLFHSFWFIIHPDKPGRMGNRMELISWFSCCVVSNLPKGWKVYRNQPICTYAVFPKHLIILCWNKRKILSCCVYQHPAKHDLSQSSWLFPWNYITSSDPYSVQLYFRGITSNSC